MLHIDLHQEAEDTLIQEELDRFSEIRSTVMEEGGYNGYNGYNDGTGGQSCV